MDSRYYSLEEKKFISDIKPYTATHYKLPRGPAEINHHQFFCAVLCVLRAGVSWRDVPSCYDK